MRIISLLVTSAMLLGAANAKVTLACADGNGNFNNSYTTSACFYAFAPPAAANEKSHCSDCGEHKIGPKLTCASPTDQLSNSNIARVFADGCKRVGGSGQTIPENI